MAIFNSYVKLPEGRDCSAENDDQPWDLDFHMTPIFHASPVADDTSAVPPPPRIDRFWLEQRAPGESPGKLKLRIHGEWDEWGKTMGTLW